MSKKVYLVLLAAVLTAGYAQAQLTFGARAGLNLTNVSVKVGNSSTSGDMKPGIQLGVVAEYSLNESFVIQPGLLFAQQGTKTEYSYSDRGVSMKGKDKMILNYLQIPVNAQYKVDLGGMKLLLQAGPYLGFAISGKMKGEETFEGRKEKYDQKLEFGSDNGYYKRFDFGLGIGAGLEFGNIQVGLGYNLGLANIRSSEDNKVKNSGLALTGTYFFGK